MPLPFCSLWLGLQQSLTALFASMPLEIAQQYKLRVSGDEWGSDSADSKVSWTAHADDVVDVGGELFVYLVPSSHGLAQLITHGLPDLPVPLPKNWSLTRSEGLRHLIANRNRAAWPNPCGLFAAADDIPLKTRKRPKTDDDTQQVVLVAVPAFGEHEAREVRCKRPSHPRDRLAVQLDKEVLNHVLLYLRSTSFDEDAKQKTRGFRGVWENPQRSGFIVRYFDTKKEKVSYKSVKSAQEGAAFLDALDAAESDGDESLSAAAADPSSQMSFAGSTQDSIRAETS